MVATHRRSLAPARHIGTDLTRSGLRPALPPSRGSQRVPAQRLSRRRTVPARRTGPPSEPPPGRRTSGACVLMRTGPERPQTRFCGWIFQRDVLTSLSFPGLWKGGEICLCVYVRKTGAQSVFDHPCLLIYPYHYGLRNYD